ncbi:MAG TPA: phosphoribosylglycinamide formyltransferase, partial [Candidatus Agrococcus pullicola]|nr:phosphoribosylglycinamide formyltransferase [Candidatus Agrococcus pullicola]
VVLVSGSGTNFADLLARIQRGDLNAEIVAVGADRACAGLAYADEHGIPTFVEPFARTREEWSNRVVDAIESFDPDLTLLSGFMRLLAPDAVERLAPNLLNTHPAYLPEFPGAHAVRDALAAGAEQTGASVIVVDGGVDTGPIVAQERIAIEPGDTEATLHERIKPIERELAASVIADIAAGTLRLTSRTT